MPVGKRGVTASERADLWQRWRAGQSLSDISRALGKAPGSVFGYLGSAGGIPPAMRCRSARILTLADREDLGAGGPDPRLAAGAFVRGHRACSIAPGEPATGTFLIRCGVIPHHEDVFPSYLPHAYGRLRRQSEGRHGEDHHVPQPRPCPSTPAFVRSVSNAKSSRKFGASLDRSGGSGYQGP